MQGNGEYPRGERNVPSRHAERAAYDVATVHAILDEALVAHVGFVVEDTPSVLPMLYVREGESLFLHGSTGAHLNRIAVRDRLPLCVEVTLFDGLVLARSVFSHSVNYRSVVVSGEGTLVRDSARKGELLDALVERIVPGRLGDARPPSEMELRQTAVIELPLENVSAKVRRGDPKDEGEDLSRRCWAGTVPLVSRWGEPVAASDLAEGLSLPAYLRDLVASPGRD